MDDQQHTGADGVQILVPLNTLQQLMELPKEVQQLREEVFQLKRRMDGVGGIHYDIFCKIKELKDML